MTKGIGDLSDEDLDVTGGDAAQFSLMAAPFKNAGGNYDDGREDAAGSMTTAPRQKAKGKLQSGWNIKGSVSP